MGALNRAIDDHAFGKAHLGALFERLGPDTLDVHADGRLVRLERGQGEFWLLGLMLAGLKTHAGGLFARPSGPQRHMRGFFWIPCSGRSNCFQSIYGRSRAANGTTSAAS